MSRLKSFLAAFLPLASASMPVSAVPPSPPPMASIEGPGPLCGPGFAFVLDDDESADQFDPNHWVVSGPGWSLGLRAIGSEEAATIRDALRGRHSLGSTIVPGLGEVERHPVVEYPGNRQRGWAYWIPPAEGTGGYLLAASDQFDGTGADHARLLRLLFGEARATLCVS